jgi:hypothetical protein
MPTWKGENTVESGAAPSRLVSVRDLQETGTESPPRRIRRGQKTIGYPASHRGESLKTGGDIGQTGDDMVLQLSFALNHSRESGSDLF